MSYTHAKRNKQTPPSVQGPEQVPEQGPSLDALRAGLARPSAEQKGRRVDLPDAMRAKMEASFGADLSAVKLYESESVADAGAQAVTRGSEIAFAPGMLDFSSFGGQALLGHELSHVVSQSRGEVSQSGGFLNDHALEARADREGAMAAAGQQIAMPTAAVSAVSAAPAAGPMQAKKGKKSKKSKKDDEYLNTGILTTNARKIDYTKADQVTYKLDQKKKKPEALRDGMADMEQRLDEKFSTGYDGMLTQSMQRPANEGEKSGVKISGLIPARTFKMANRDTETSVKDLETMYVNLMAPHKQGMNAQEQKTANADFDEGVKSYKKVLYHDLKRIEKKYGTMLTQMHPEDVLNQVSFDDLIADFSGDQDRVQMLEFGKQYFDPEHNEEDQDFMNLQQYYNGVLQQYMGYNGLAHGKMESSPEMIAMGVEGLAPSQELESKVSGPRMNEKQLARYMKEFQKRKKKKYLKGRLFGRFK